MAQAMSRKEIVELLGGRTPLGVVLRMLGMDLGTVFALDQATRGVYRRAKGQEAARCFWPRGVPYTLLGLVTTHERRVGALSGISSVRRQTLKEFLAGLGLEFNMSDREVKAYIAEHA